MSPGRAHCGAGNECFRLLRRGRGRCRTTTSGDHFECAVLDQGKMLKQELGEQYEAPEAVGKE